MHKVMIHPADYDNCREAIDKAFDLFPLDIEGKNIMVKPNVLNDAPPDEGVTTHPCVLRAVVERLEDSGAAEITVGDNPGGRCYGANEETFRRCGLLEASKGYYKNIGIEASVLELESRIFSRLSVSKAVLESDIFISIPKFKTHGLTIVTGAVKNSYGILPGAQKANGHRVAGNPSLFNELVVDVFGLRVPDLFSKIMASDNAVALDATIARMMGVNPGNLRFLEIAKERGYGDYAKDGIEISGYFSPISGFKLPPSAEERKRNGPRHPGGGLERHTRMRPKAEDTLCTGCGTCVEECPVSALSMVDGLPVVDPDACIVCYCCQENCPEKAIQLS
ncbi:MAG: DUF362 domain-containing protein [Deltaproteobacteria bacterium]|nr:DUF362 domain-containing protein [Deltaproteobacteria bacterium]